MFSLKPLWLNLLVGVMVVSLETDLKNITGGFNEATAF